MASGSSGSSDAGNVSPSPASILLAKEAHIAFSRNHTTARAKRLGSNSTVEVTFWTDDPPDVSFYTLYCKPHMAIPNADLEVQSRVAPIPVCTGGDVCIRPRVVGAEGRFVLLSTLFRGDCWYEYFMYKGDPKSPSLESLPFPDDDYSLRGEEFAIVPCGDDDHYLLIALCCVPKMNNYWLHIYSSEYATWTTKELPNPCPRILIIPDKVFVIRDGLLLWVDLLGGILVCDVLQEPHHAEYIPLPEPLLGNRERVKTFQRGVRRFRDLTCVDDLIKFIEMEHREIIREIPDDVPPEKPVDPMTNHVLYDSDLITLVDDKPVKPKTRIEVSVNGWSAMTWTRNIGSNCWRKGRIVDVDDILVDDSVFSALLSSEKSESAGSLTFKNLSSAWPILSTDGNDILYLKSTSTSGGGGALVAVDLAEKKTVKVEARRSHPFGKYFYSSPWHILRPCALANHLKMTPGIETSASQIALMGSSANEPNNTASTMHKMELRVLYRTFLSHRPILIKTICLRSYGLTGGSSRATLGTHHGPIKIICHCRNASTTGLDPLTLCIHYTPMPPAPIIHSYGNYQSLWQQPLLLEQKEAPSTFGPHEAPHQFFNNWCGARYIGNSQQHPTGNSCSYGAPSGSGNYHQHR